MIDSEYFGKRFEMLLKSLNINKLAIAQKLDVSHTTISNIINQTNSPSIDKIVKIFSLYPQINFDWLITGRGKMFLDESETDNIVNEVMQKEIEPENDSSRALSIIESQQDALRKMSEAALIQAQSMSRLIEKLEEKPDDVSKAG